MLIRKKTRQRLSIAVMIAAMAFIVGIVVPVKIQSLRLAHVNESAFSDSIRR